MAPIRQLSTTNLARLAARHPWLVVSAWVVLIATAVLPAGSLSGLLADDWSESTEASRAQQLIDARLLSSSAAEEFVVVESEALQTTDPAFEQTVSGIVEELRQLDVVASAVSFLDGVPGMASDSAALIAVTLTASPADAGDQVGPLVEVVERFDRDGDFRVSTVGDGSVDREFDRLADETMVRGEMLGIGLALVILLLVFGAAVAAGLPILVAMLSITLAMAATSVAARILTLSPYVLNIITMIGLAVGIDYTLLIVQRFREEIERGVDRVEAVTTAGRTAARSVLFSGVAVAIALIGMLTAPVAMFRALGLGSIIVVLMTVLAALTLLPAILRLLGPRVNWLTLPFFGRRRRAEGGGFWDMTTRAVTAHPVLSVLVTATLLLGASASALTMQLGTAGIASLPTDSNALHAFKVVIRDFGGDVVSADVVIDGADVSSQSVREGIAKLTALTEADPIFGPASLEVAESEDIALLKIAILADYSDRDAQQAVTRLREEYIPAAFTAGDAEILVGGPAASVMDGVDLIAGYMPIVLTLVLGASFVLLTLVFRSIVVPLKAVLMNLLSVGAAYGLMVLVFQQGIGASWFNFRQVEVIEYWIPLFLFSILFGLSMDYHVFLLSRIRERYLETQDNRASVAHGLRSTGSIITGAALIMVAVFGGFATSEITMFQQMGFGLAVAIILDATVVRSVLVPASMELLGDWNWYFPDWLSWLPHLSVDASYPSYSRSVPVPAPVVALDASPELRTLR